VPRKQLPEPAVLLIIILRAGHKPVPVGLRIANILAFLVFSLYFYPVSNRAASVLKAWLFPVYLSWEYRIYFFTTHFII
jgi:hypothetical protein